MSIPQILEVAIGLIFIYYILGALVSLMTQVVMESLQTRGVALEKYLKIMAGDMAVDLTNLPQIKALRPIRFARWWNIFGAGVVVTPTGWNLRTRRPSPSASILEAVLLNACGHFFPLHAKPPWAFLPMGVWCLWGARVSG